MIATSIDSYEIKVGFERRQPKNLPGAATFRSLLQLGLRALGVVFFD